jgi:hypothetical protein
MAEARELGVVTSYSDLHAIMRARANELAISRECLDELAGLHHGYSGKLLAPRPIRSLGDMSIRALLPALGIKLVAVADPEALERISSRLVKRCAEKVRTAQCITITLSFLHRIARRGGTNSRKYMSREQASELGRLAALARWKNGAD